MKRFKNILCVVEPNRSENSALERAVSLAERNHASLTVVHVTERPTAGIGMPQGGPISADLQAWVRRSHMQSLDAMVEPFRKRFQIQTKVLLGVPFLEIIREVLRTGTDLVIDIPETPDWIERFFGSDDMHLLRKCPCPVWLIKPRASKPFRRILAAVDVGENFPMAEVELHKALNRQILEMAASLASSDSAELHVVHVWEAIGEGIMRSAMQRTPEEEINAYVDAVRRQRKFSLRSVLAEVMDSIAEDSSEPLNPSTHLVQGSARKEIPMLAKKLDADLVVMGTVGRTGIPGFFMGNTAETTLNQIDCSVLAIKPPGFQTPVTCEE